MKISKQYSSVKKNALVLAAAWTLIVGASVAWNSYQEQEGAETAASVSARAQFEKDVIYRRWNAGHGGVYVPITESSPPNPYLTEVDERDIETTTGRKLTLINPAYMTRQVHELGLKTAGVHGHITSLNPIRPANAPDDWEREALESFEQDKQEFVSIKMLNGEEHLRLMRPLITEKGCLQCHEHQGYKVGDVRGGISVSVPMAPYLSIAQNKMKAMIVGHVLLWLLGIATLYLGAGNIERRNQERNRAEKERKSLEDSLYQKNKMASVGQLAAGVAHEINNPIGFIISNLNFIDSNIKQVIGQITGGNDSPHKEPQDLDYTIEDLDDAISESIEGAGRVRKIVLDLKGFARADVCSKQFSNLHAGLESTLNIAKSQFRLGCKVEIDFGEIPEIECFPNRINQVFLNLLVNAGQCVQDSSGVITVKTWADDSKVYISIRDNGCGIPEENMPKLFDAFFTTKDVGQGTGLGLHIAYDIVTKHGGSLTVDSKVNEGTEFVVSLPIVTADKCEMQPTV